MSLDWKGLGIKVWISLAAVYLIWGSTYLAIRFAIETLPPFGMAAVRFLIAGTILYAGSRLAGAPRPTLPQWRSAALIGALLLLGGNGAVVWAEQRIDSGMAALLIATEPLWVVLLIWARRDGQRPGRAIFTGLGLGLLGMILLVRPQGDGSLDPLGVAALIFATLSWAVGSVYSQRAKLPSSSLLSTGMQMLAGGFLFAVTSAIAGEPQRFDPSAVSLRSAGALLYLIVFGALVAYSAYSWLLRSAPPVLVSTYAYVNPVVAVLLGWALAGEKLTAGTLGAAAIILAGVVLLSLASTKTQGDGPPDEPRTADEGLASASA
jgi:drug/metabolite transporter (DMT)-like permease